MTANQFNAECAARSIDSATALENAIVRAALAARDDAAVQSALDNEF